MYQRMGSEGGKAETVKSLSPLSDWIQLNSVLERENYGREIALLQSAQNLVPEISVLKLVAKLM